MSDQPRLGFRLRYVEVDEDALGDLLGPYDIERLRGVIELAIENADPLAIAALLLRGAGIFAREVDEVDVEVVLANDEHELPLTGAFPRGMVAPMPQG